ncbi:MAG: aminotransferase class V-fold PLP-dependent enzyme [Phycisphaeraceae bacterium]|nr:aminotransferase class V-fold PLP-dependent enzyme [Phycisphaeraceae bacterium]
MSLPATQSRGAGRKLPVWSDLAPHWRLSPEVVFLNHGSFGAVPSVVHEHQRRLRDLLEAEPVRFFVELYEPMMDQAKAEVGAFIGCSPEDFGFVLNATMGVNTVAASLELSPGDELLTSDQEYNACNNALERAAQRAGARVVRASLPFPVAGEDQVVQAITGRITDRTRLVMVSHITSPTGLVLPVERLVREIQGRGIDVLVDGAHGPGMVPLNVDSLGAAYYTGNFHKWVCAPKGSAFLHVRRDRQAKMRPLIVSHGANSPRKDRSRFRLEFDYPGTIDVSAWLSVPEAIRCVGGMMPGGWPEVMKRNREMALLGRETLCRALRVEAPAPESMIGSLAAVRLPDRRQEEGAPVKYADPLNERLVSRHAVQVPIVTYPAPPARLVRIAMQMYNSIEQVEYLAEALREELDIR